MKLGAASVACAAWCLFGRAASAGPGALTVTENDATQLVDGFFNNTKMVAEHDQDPHAPRFGFDDDGFSVNRKLQPFTQAYDGIHLRTENAVYASAADKQVAWLSADVVNRGSGMGGEPPPPGWFGDWHHGIALMIARPKGVQVLAYTMMTTIADADQAKVIAAGGKPPPIPRRIDAGAEAVAKQFEATIGNPAAFAATISDRPDVVLFGSSRLDRKVGGKDVAAQLTKWNLALKERDGIQAGLAGPTVAWVAANVDAGAKGGKPTPYQLFAIYENAGGAWKIVALSFAFFQPTSG